MGTDQSFRRLPGIDYRKAFAGSRRRKRRRRPFYRRKLVLVPSLGLLCVLILVSVVAYRANSLMASLQSVSTPPSVITDSTYIEDNDAAVASTPITVETDPAQAALAANTDARSEPQTSQDEGFLQGLSSDIRDVVGGAAVASGMRDGSDEGFTVLVMGVDARPGTPIDIGVRPDVLMLIRFDPESHSCRMLSIPRDTRVELPGYGQTKINHALMVGGIPYQQMVTEDLIGQSIDHYVLIDFETFKEAVNVVGGVTVVVPEELREDGQVVYTAGTHEFGGEEALAFARHRAAPDGDLGRVERQWSLLAGLADAAQSRDLVGDVNRLVPTVEDHIRTDLTLTEMATIARDYGNNCLSINQDNIAMLRGTRVQFPDPILDQILYYNVVPQSTVIEQVETWRSGGPGESVRVAADRLAGAVTRGDHGSLTFASIATKPFPSTQRSVIP